MRLPASALIRWCCRISVLRGAYCLCHFWEECHPGERIDRCRRHRVSRDVMDCGAWVGNFMLAATAPGVGAIAQAAIASWPDVLRAHLDIAPDRRVVCGISFGYEDGAHPANGFRTSRAPLVELVSWVD